MRRHWLFFYAFAERERTQRERGDKILRWRHNKIHYTHYHARGRETAWVFPETLEVRAGTWGRLAVSDSKRIVPYRLDQSRVEAYTGTPRDFPRRLFLHPVPWAAARTAPNGVKERASFCLVFRSLNTTSSHRMFSMGYRRAKSTQGNTNFQKKNFLTNSSGITTRGP